jgi:hypothetical protein
MSEVLRTDLLDHGMNAGKERKVFDMLRAWRACAVVVGREQWRLFFETGRVKVVNRWKAWFGREPLAMKDGAEIPLRGHDYFAARQGVRKKTVQVNEREGRMFFGIVTDMGEVCEEQRLAYQPRCEEIALDYGLRTLFATDQGDLLSQGFLRKLESFDHRISRLAAYRLKHGLRTRSPRYDREVRRLRSYLRTESGRVLNRLVEVQRPGRIVVERLWFRNPRLSRRMNRLVTNAAVIRALVLEFQRQNVERWGNPQGRRGTSRDPRVENAYFRRSAPEVTSNRTVATSANTACATDR